MVRSDSEAEKGSTRSAELKIIAREMSAHLYEQKRLASIDSARQRIEVRGFRIPSPEEVDRLLLVEDGINSHEIAEWGIPWPTPTGWRSYLIGIWNWEGDVLHDTVFDDAFQMQWLGIRSGVRVPLANVRAREMEASDVP